MFAVTLQGTLNRPRGPSLLKGEPRIFWGASNQPSGEPAADLQAGGSTLTGGPSSPACLALTLVGTVHHFQPLGGADDPKNSVSRVDGLPGLGAPSPGRRSVV